jgi:Cu2+-exporting ATPase
LERLAAVDTIVFDKTGTLTLGRPHLASQHSDAALQAAAALARVSRHPLSRALVAAAGPGAASASAVETPGEGVVGVVDGVPARLGKRSFAAPNAADAKDGAPELWFARGDEAPVRFAFSDEIRGAAASTIEALRARGYAIEMLSGDREAAATETARALGIVNWRAGVTPAEKTAHVQRLRTAGRKVLMVGDGLNDAAALAAAHASASLGSAVEASQAAADIVLQGNRLSGIVDAIKVAKAARARSFENLGFSAAYNVIAAPLAALGFLTPLIAACAMSGSSLLVTLNALRMQRT